MARSRDSKARVTRVSLPSEQELAIMRNYESGVGGPAARRTATGRSNSYAMTEEQAVGAAALMERSQVISPLAGLPIAASAGEFSFAKAVLGSASGDHGMWDDYWEDEQGGYDFENRAGQQIYDREGENVGEIPGWAVVTNKQNRGRSREPAPITLIPTSTTNPDRPRTVAAGYAVDRAVLTVVFRDGTFYNYYDVEHSTWVDFKASFSKGVFIRETLDYYGRGTANMSKAPVAHREQAYRIARTGQLTYDGHPGGQFDRTQTARVDPTRQRRRSAAPPNNGMRKAQ